MVKIQGFGGSFDLDMPILSSGTWIYVIASKPCQISTAKNSIVQFRPYWTLGELLIKFHQTSPNIKIKFTEEKREALSTKPFLGKVFENSFFPLEKKFSKSFQVHCLHFPCQGKINSPQSKQSNHSKFHFWH